MKRLLILRHAKSSWALPGVTDHQRPLNNRGVEQTGILADWFSNQSMSALRVLCSSSLRTLETYEGLVKKLDQPQLETLDKLYEGSVDDYLEAIFSQQDQDVLIIGHNPTCDELVRYLAKPTSPAWDKLMARHFGTANLALLQFSSDDWSELSEASCELMEFFRPE